MQRLVVSLTKSNEYNRIELKLNFVVFPFTVGNNLRNRAAVAKTLS